MTRVAAVDTTTWWGGVALVESTGHGQTRLAAEVGLQVHDSHTSHLLSLLETLLDRAGWPRSSVDVWAASRGPGSFTGVRVGLGTIRGLGLASRRPCLGVTSLQALAEAFGRAQADRTPLLGAGRGEVYGARYDGGSSPPAELVPPWVGPPRRALEGAPGPVVVFGPGAEAHRELLDASGGSTQSLTVAQSPRSVAAAVGRLALLRLEQGAGDGDGLSPLYIRPPDAEIKAQRR